MTIRDSDGYLALPPIGKGQLFPVLHIWWGLKETIKAYYDSLATEGFSPFAIDLFHRKMIDTI
jgi:dienelactone hydrolase